MNLSKKNPKNINPSKKANILTKTSHFFYRKSNLFNALLLTSIFVAYLLLVLTKKAKAFEVANSTVKSLGTSLGFGQVEILAFFAQRSDIMITEYINFNQVHDSLFALIYALMYVLWLSVLLKPISEKIRFLNLLPFAQSLFDWLENFALAALSKQYLDDNTISSTTALLASTSSTIKWVISLLLYLLILLALLLNITKRIKNKKTNTKIKKVIINKIMCVLRVKNI